MRQLPFVILFVWATALTVQCASQIIQVQNHTGEELQAIYASKPTDTDWGSPRTGSVAEGQGQQIEVSGTDCIWDIAGMTAEGRFYSIRRVDICGGAAFTLKRFDADFPLQTVGSPIGPGQTRYLSITNGTGTDFIAIYASRPSNPNWGDARGGYLGNGQTTRVALTPDSAGDCHWDVGGQTTLQDVFSQRGVDICRVEAITLTLSDQD